MLKVVKFGGSSLADSKQFKKVKDIILSDPARKVVVVSAAGKRFGTDYKITDLLYLCHAHITYGVEFDSIFEMVASRYRDIKNDLGLDIDIEADIAKIRDKMLDKISLDELVSRGEYLSARLMASYLGFDFADASRWVQFSFDQTIDTEKSYAALREIKSDKGIVIPGFYGVMPNGDIKIMNRGGSDITGALAAAALEADVYENWTDVSGILMADPRIVKDPKPVEKITYDELRELSYMGAKVLHEETIFPVKNLNIPLNVRNTNDPSHKGTLIMESFPESEDDCEQFITGIAGKKNFSIIHISKSEMSSEVGTLRKILEAFEKFKVSVEHVPSGIDTVSVVVSTDQFSKVQYDVLAELQKSVKPDSIDVTENIAIVAMVGRKMAKKPGISGKLFRALGENNINIRMINQGPDELNIIVGIDNKDFDKAINILYSGFVK